MRTLKNQEVLLGKTFFAAHLLAGRPTSLYSLIAALDDDIQWSELFLLRVYV